MSLPYGLARGEDVAPRRLVPPEDNPGNFPFASQSDNFCIVRFRLRQSVHHRERVRHFPSIWHPCDLSGNALEHDFSRAAKNRDGKFSAFSGPPGPSAGPGAVRKRPGAGGRKKDGPGAPQFSWLPFQAGCPVAA